MLTSFLTPLCQVGSEKFATLDKTDYNWANKPRSTYIWRVNSPITYAANVTGQKTRKTNCSYRWSISSRYPSHFGERAIMGQKTIVSKSANWWIQFSEHSSCRLPAIAEKVIEGNSIFHSRPVAVSQLDVRV